MNLIKICKKKNLLYIIHIYHNMTLLFLWPVCSSFYTYLPDFQGHIVWSMSRLSQVMGIDR